MKRRPIIHRDRNHCEVLKDLRSYGVYVVETFDPLDLLCYYRGFTAWVEVKTEARNTTYTRKQIEFISTCPMPVCIAKSGKQAFDFIRGQIGLTQSQKDALGVFLMRNAEAKFHPAAIESALSI